MNSGQDFLITTKQDHEEKDIDSIIYTAVEQQQY